MIDNNQHLFIPNGGNTYIHNLIIILKASRKNSTKYILKELHKLNNN